MTDDDTDAAIAELLTEAAVLASAATAKLAETCRLAERAKGNALRVVGQPGLGAFCNPVADQRGLLALALERVNCRRSMLRPSTLTFCQSE